MSAPDLRDRGLRRISRLTGWLAAAGLIAVGGFAGLLARPQPSSAKTSTAVDPASAASTQAAPGAQTPSTTASGKTSGSSSAKAGSTKKASPPITRPVQPPVQSRQRGPAVSGGS